MRQRLLAGGILAEQDGHRKHICAPAAKLDAAIAQPLFGAGKVIAIEHLTLVTATMADRFPVGVHPEVITAAQRAWIKHVQYKIAESTTSLPRQRQS